ncbi:MAG TPA: hypothetical protein VH083_02335 [Myxococcales bacterium]|jgi:hypothetical protein|nr:hypothetical protein [Myxococcales bacterium]
MKNEAHVFRRAFTIGLLTLGVAVGGQMATSQPALRTSSRSRPAPVSYGAPRTSSYLAQRVVRAVVSAVLYSFS